MSEAKTLSEIRVPRTLGPQDGAGPARARAAAADRALGDLIDGALGTDVAIAAVGGYGRGDLSPHSDIDLLLLVPPRSTVTRETFRGLLYPLWDAGFQVGYAVRTPKEAVEQSRSDLHAATGLLSARLVGGATTLFEEMRDRQARRLRRDARSLVRRIVEATSERHRKVDRAGWSLAPDLKEDVGGLRDRHTIGWIQAAVAASGPGPAITAAGDYLLAVREALHALVPRRYDKLRIDLQPPIAERLGMTTDESEGGRADRMMEGVHSAARVIERGLEEEIEKVRAQVFGGPRRSGRVEDLGNGMSLEDGVLMLSRPRHETDLADVLALLAARSETGRPISIPSLGRAREVLSGAPVQRWSDGMRTAFLRLLKGPHVVDALESLDHLWAWTKILPEWLPVRGRAQHDPYHRYTVDGHSFTAVARLQGVLADDPVVRPASGDSDDILFLATLLHDVGKGSGRDHSVAGAELARSAGTRMGLDPNQVDALGQLVRLHLLLPDTATRRDLDDGAVIEMIVDAVGDRRTLGFLYGLAAADGLATGPEAWTTWKASLVRELVHKAFVALDTGAIPQRSDVVIHARSIEAYDPSLAGRAEAVLASLPPSYLDSVGVPEAADEFHLILTSPEPGEVRYRCESWPGGRSSVTVCVPDRPGTLARTAGVLALHRVPVLSAQAFSTNDGLALERFIVGRLGGDERAALGATLEDAYAGRLALDARLSRKIKDYAGGPPHEVDVRILEDASAHSTVIEVRCEDMMGLLYAIASALGDLDLDIRVAKIDTLGTRVVDVFYVRTATGGKLDPHQATEVVDSIKHHVERLVR